VFHHELIACLHQSLWPLLSDRYHARLAERHYTIEGPPSPEGLPRGCHEEYIEVCQCHDGRLVTLIDVVSPANKQTAGGRRAYQATHDQAWGQGANVVEIDLVMPGPAHRQGFPPWDYVVTVTRQSQPDRSEIYAAAFPLPRFRIPLASDDRDTILDVHTAVAQAFDRGGFSSSIDCQRHFPLEERSGEGPWLQALLGPHRFRPAESPPALHGHAFPHEVIAVAAYFLWENEGWPEGRDKEHWYRAIDQLHRQHWQDST
jgi:hypothetical protein